MSENTQALRANLVIAFLQHGLPDDDSTGQLADTLIEHCLQSPLKSGADPDVAVFQEAMVLQGDLRVQLLQQGYPNNDSANVLAGEILALFAESDLAVEELRTFVC